MEGAWSSVQGCLPLLVSVKTKLGKIQAGMKVWSRNSFGNITKKIANIRKNLKDAESKAVQGSRGPTGFDSNSEEGATNTAGARRKIMAAAG